MASNTAGRGTATRKQYNTLVSVVLCDQLLNDNRSQCQPFALSCILILPLSEGHTLTQSDTPRCHAELFRIFFSRVYNVPWTVCPVRSRLAMALGRINGLGNVAISVSFRLAKLQGSFEIRGTPRRKQGKAPFPCPLDP